MQEITNRWSCDYFWEVCFGNMYSVYQERAYRYILGKLVTFRKFWWFFRKKGITMMSPNFELAVIFCWLFLHFVIKWDSNQWTIYMIWSFFSFFKIKSFWEKSDIRTLSLFLLFSILYKCDMNYSIFYIMNYLGWWLGGHLPSYKKCHNFWKTNGINLKFCDFSSDLVCLLFSDAPPIFPRKNGFTLLM